MSTQKIEREIWAEYFDNLSNNTDSKLLRLEIVGLSVGDQVEAEDVKFLGINYDENVISIRAGSSEYVLKQPRVVYVQKHNEDVLSMEIIDAEDNKHILSFSPVAQV